MSITANMRDWQTVRRLGRGLSGEVYEARRANVTAALKICRPSEAFGADQFRREIANARIVHGIIPDGSPRGPATARWFLRTADPALTPTT